MRYKIFKGSNKRRLTIIISAIAILAFVSYRLYLYMDERYMKPARCEDNIVLPSARPSSEKESPFRWEGRPLSAVSENDVLMRRYSPAIARFPDVIACLEDSEKGKPIPNLVEFDWEKINETEDADVCLFRVFSSLGNPDASIKWLQSQGFQTKILPDTTDGVVISAQHIPSECGIRLDESNESIRIINYLFFGPGYKFLNVAAGFNKDGEIGGVSVLRITL